MKQVSEKITVRLGSLREPLAEWCEKNDVSPSEFVRELLAKKLGVAPPEMQVGNPNMGEDFWKKKSND